MRVLFVGFGEAAAGRNTDNSPSFSSISVYHMARARFEYDVHFSNNVVFCFKIQFSSTAEQQNYNLHGSTADVFGIKPGSV